MHGGTRLSARRIPRSPSKSPAISNLGHFLRVEHLKNHRKLSDLIWTSTTDTLVLRPTPGSAAVRWALDTNGLHVDRLCSPSSALAFSAARMNAVLDDLLHVERCRKPRHDWICAVWGEGTGPVAC